MARRRVHDDDAILDTARDLVVGGGPQAATTAAISAASGAPIGSLYHRFDSRAGLLAEVWIRTVRRFHEGLLAAVDHGTGIAAAVSFADWTVEFGLRRPHDAHLLLRTSREDLLGSAQLPAETREALADLNRPVGTVLHRLATEIFGAATPDRIELLTIAVIDLPYTTVRRHLRHGTPPDLHRPLVADAVRTLLETAARRQPHPGE